MVNTLITILSIGSGGALGALARHFLSTGIAAFMRMPYPWGTLTVNVLGSFLMGLLIAGFIHIWNPSQNIKLFLLTGFLGAFTTFSTFSLDVMTLWTRGDVTGTIGYVLGSVILSVAAVFLGSFLVWKIAG